MNYFKSKLWRNKNFNFLWAGMTVSLVGTEVSNLALPLVALTILNAGAMEVAVLKAAEMVAFPFLGLFAGVMADRLNPRRIMIVADISRFFLLAIVPVAYMINLLNIYLLIMVASVMSIFSVFFSVSYSTFVPLIVEREQLVEGNSKLNISQSIAQFVGPMLAGWLILIVSAVKSLIVDVFSYLFSAIMLLMAKQSRQSVDDISPNKLNQKSVWKDIRAGLDFVFSNKTLRTLTIATAFANLGHSITQPMFLVFAYKKLGINSAEMGIILALGSIGLFLGALIASATSEKLGLGKTLFCSMGIVGVGAALAPLALLGARELILTLAWFTICFADTIYNINQFSLRQLLTPIELQGRMNATVRIVIMGIVPVGSVLGGILASSAGLVAALIAGGVAYLMVPLIVYFSHLYTISNQPEGDGKFVEPKVNIVG